MAVCFYSPYTQLNIACCMDFWVLVTFGTSFHLNLSKTWDTATEHGTCDVTMSKVVYVTVERQRTSRKINENFRLSSGLKKKDKAIGKSNTEHALYTEWPRKGAKSERSQQRRGPNMKEQQVQRSWRKHKFHLVIIDGVPSLSYYKQRYHVIWEVAMMYLKLNK